MDVSSWIFDHWHTVARTALVGVLAYCALIIALRVSGKRTLSKMNAFDLVVTIALGSTLASALIAKDVSLVQALTAFAVLIGLQFVVAFASARSPKFDQLIKGTPALLAYRGELLHENMRSERIAVDELYAALRQRGCLSLAEVEAVVLETEGTLSVMKKDGAATREESPSPVLDGVRQDSPRSPARVLSAAPG